MNMEKEMTRQQATYLNNAGMPNPFIELLIKIDPNKFYSGLLIKYTNSELMRWLMERGFVLQFEKEIFGFYRKSEESKIRCLPYKDITDALVDACCMVCYDISDKNGKDRKND